MKTASSVPASVTLHGQVYTLAINATWAKYNPGTPDRFDIHRDGELLINTVSADEVRSRGLGSLLPAPVAAPAAGVTDPLECECDSGKLIAGALPAPAAPAVAEVLSRYPSADAAAGVYAPASRIPAVVDGNANAWGAAMHEAGLSFCFDDDPATIFDTRTGKRLFSDAEAAEVSAILEEFTGEEYADAMSGCMDAMHEDNAYMAQKTGCDDEADAQKLHGTAKHSTI